MASLKIHICAIHKISNSSPEREIIANYLKRIPWTLTMSELELKGTFPSDKQKILEGELLLKSIPTGSFAIALDEQGKEFSSKEFSNHLEKITQPICFIIGGAFGLSTEVKERANMLLSLSKMTMPHIMARLMLIEQIYRAYTISKNHPYHK